MLHTKYISSGPHGFREEDFLSLSHYKSMGAYGPQDVANLDPRGGGVVGSGNGVVYLTSPGRPTEIGLQLGKACYPCSR